MVEKRRYLNHKSFIINIMWLLVINMVDAPHACVLVDHPLDWVHVKYYFSLWPPTFSCGHHKLFIITTIIYVIVILWGQGFMAANRPESEGKTRGQGQFTYVILLWYCLFKSSCQLWHSIVYNCNIIPSDYYIAKLDTSLVCW